MRKLEKMRGSHHQVEPRAPKSQYRVILEDQSPMAVSAVSNADRYHYGDWATLEAAKEFCRRQDEPGPGLTYFVYDDRGMILFERTHDPATIAA